MKYIIEHIKDSREGIVNQLLVEIQEIQRNEPAISIESLKAEIENLTRKKHKAIDLMLDDLISKDDLKKQTEFYDNEIALVTGRIAASKNVSDIHKKQLDGIKSYIDKVNEMVGLDTNETAILR